MQNKVNEWLNSGEYISDVDELKNIYYETIRKIE